MLFPSIKRIWSQNYSFFHISKINKLLLMKLTQIMLNEPKIWQRTQNDFLLFYCQLIDRFPFWSKTIFGMLTHFQLTTQIIERSSINTFHFICWMEFVFHCSKNWMKNENSKWNTNEKREKKNSFFKNQGFVSANSSFTKWIPQKFLWMTKNKTFNDFCVFLKVCFI